MIALAWCELMVSDLEELPWAQQSGIVGSCHLPLDFCLSAQATALRNSPTGSQRGE
jgi:hypothetical protein